MLHSAGCTLSCSLLAWSCHGNLTMRDGCNSSPRSLGACYPPFSSGSSRVARGLCPCQPDLHRSPLCIEPPCKCSYPSYYLPILQCLVWLKHGVAVQQPSGGRTIQAPRRSPPSHPVTPLQVALPAAAFVVAVPIVIPALPLPVPLPASTNSQPLASCSAANSLICCICSCTCDPCSCLCNSCGPPTHSCASNKLGHTHHKRNSIQPTCCDPACSHRAAARPPRGPCTVGRQHAPRVNIGKERKEIPGSHMHLHAHSQQCHMHPKECAVHLPHLLRSRL